jgi:hypothetical protein
MFVGRIHQISKSISNPENPSSPENGNTVLITEYAQAGRGILFFLPR